MMKIYYLIGFLAISIKSFSQETNDNISPPKISPPSATTFSLSKINFDSSNSGDFTYTYPLAKIGNSIEIPISLNYTSGVRVDDIGSSVGMSWQLNGGGVISRVVRDEMDEISTENHWFPPEVNESSDLQLIRSAAASGNNIDTEHDIFNFSISNGLSGSFYIDHNLDVFVLSKDNIKIEISDKTITEDLYGKILEFKITDNRGNQYFFGGQENAIEKSTILASGPNQNSTTGWYLVKIVTADQQQILFNYSIETLYYYTNMGTSFSFTENCPLSGGVLYSYSQPSKSKTAIKALRPALKEIIHQNESIRFNYNKQRNDILSNSQLLTNVEILYDNEIVNSYTLDFLEVLSGFNEDYYGLLSNEVSTRTRYYLSAILNNKTSSSHTFIYDNPNSIPPRFSLDTDYFGYPNGKNNNSPFPIATAENEWSIFSSIPGSASVTSLFSAEKDVNPTYAGRGNLIKIIYPTKGSSEISYEPNKSSRIKKIPIDSYSEKILHSEYNSCNSTNTAGNFSFPSNGGKIKFNSHAFFDENTQCGESSDKDVHTLRIINVTDNIELYKRTLKINQDHSGELLTVNGKEYRIEYTVTSRLAAIWGSSSITYNYISGTKDIIEPIYFGGSRIAAIEEKEEDKIYSRKVYYYNSIDNIEKSSTSIRNFNGSLVYTQISDTSRSCDSGNSTFPNFLIMKVYSGSSSNMALSFSNSSQRPFYNYTTVIEEGRMANEKKYSFISNNFPAIIRPPIIYNLPMDNLGEIETNLLEEDKLYSFENNKYAEIKRTVYEYNFKQVNYLKNHVFRENFSYTPNNYEDPLINISYGYYLNAYGFVKPTRITTEDFANGKKLTSYTTLNYDQLNYNLSDKEEIDITQNILKTNYSYAYEKGNTFLTGKNMVGIPLESEVKKNGVVISKTETKYPVSQAEADLKTSGLPLPVSVSSLDLQSNAMNMGVLYKKYDSRGNLLQYNLKPDVNGNSGNPVTIIWDYNQTQPIAKIEGANLSDIPQGLITNIVNASDYSNASYSESNLIDQLDAFRIGLPGYQISTYTYKPLIGVSSITPPSGIREIYIYDTANRLQAVKDVNGNVLKEYEYHYKP